MYGVDKGRREFYFGQSRFNTHTKSIEVKAMLIYNEVRVLKTLIYEGGVFIYYDEGPPSSGRQVRCEADEEEVELLGCFFCRGIFSRMLHLQSTCLQMK